MPLAMHDGVGGYGGHLARAEATMREAVDLGITHVGMHRSIDAGRVDAAATALGREHGITVIDGGCPLMYGPTADTGHKIMSLDRQSPPPGLSSPGSRRRFRGRR